MKILLIAPTSGKWKKVSRAKMFNGKTFRFSLLSLLSVAVDTPDGNQVTIIDEQVEDIPWEEDFDLVGITCMTALAPRAYEISRIPDKFILFMDDNLTADVDYAGRLSSRLKRYLQDMKTLNFSHRS